MFLDLRTFSELIPALRDENPNVQIDLKNRNLEGADFRHTNLENADLRATNLIGANFKNTDLKALEWIMHWLLLPILLKLI